VTQVGNEFGHLHVLGGNLNFIAGELDMKIDSQVNEDDDYIRVDNTITIGAAATLNVTDISGAPVATPNLQWTIIESQAANAIIGNFGTINLPRGVRAPTNNQLAIGKYVLNS
jgi:hypothetical protein